MKRTLTLGLLLTLAGAAAASTATPAPAAQAPKADPAVGRHLDKLGFKYEVDEDGDYRMVFELADDRSQLVYVRSAVEDFGQHHVREIWSPGFQVEGDTFTAAVANRLLEASNTAKLGGWVKQNKTAMFVVKIDADASPEALSDAIDAASRSADAIELELTGKDDY